MQNIPAGSWVTQVQAVDLDEGTNGVVEYEFIQNPGTSSPDWQKFSIDRRTGNITTANYIDREEQQLYFVSLTLLEIFFLSLEKYQMTFDKLLVSVISSYMYMFLGCKVLESVCSNTFFIYNEI